MVSKQTTMELYRSRMYITHPEELLQPLSEKEKLIMSITPITMIPVESSTIAEWGHDATSNLLKVNFKGGAVYDYQNVTAEHFKQLNDAESKGKAFNALIKKDPTAFPYTRVS